LNKTGFLFLIFFFFFSCKKEKFTLLWEEIPTGTQSVLYSISSSGSDTLFAFGGSTYSSGNIIKFDADGNILLTDSIGHKAIYGSYYENNLKAKACDYSGSIFSTYDGGITWVNLQTPAWIPLQDIHSKYGWTLTVGGNAGKNGTVQSNIDTTWMWNEQRFEQELKAVAIVDSFTAFAAGYGFIIKTINRGLSWNVLNLDGDIFTDIQFLNEDVGFILGYSGLMYKTTNGGKDWHKIKVNKTRTINHGLYNALFFTDTQNGFICGNNGVILKTDNGGEAWTEAQHRFASDLFDIWYDQQKKSGFACGNNGALIKFTY
jgi:photosystem II stability/assembly factor-like uncharacterized protein